MLAAWRRLPPVGRAALTSCAVMGAGDVLCQAMQSKQRLSLQTIDWHRVARFGAVGLTLHGPFFYAGFKALDGRWPGQTAKTAFTKVLAGQLTMFPAYVVAFYLYMSALEGKSPQASVAKLQSSFAQTYAVGSGFWPAANMVNFMFVPPTQRVAYVGAVGVLWNGFLSWANSQANQPLAAGVAATAAEPLVSAAAGITPLAAMPGGKGA